MLLAIDPGADTGWAYFEKKKLTKCGLGAPPVVGVTEVLIEKPTLYPRSKARSSDVITLAVRAGECGGAYGSLGVAVEYVEPRTWKGQVPKDVHHARIWATLAQDERLVVDRAVSGLAPSKRHNVLDAVGLGLYGVGRR